MDDVRLFPSLLAWSAVPWMASEAELKVLEAVSEAELAKFLIKASVMDEVVGVERPGLTLQRPL